MATTSTHAFISKLLTRCGLIPKRVSHVEWELLEFDWSIKFYQSSADVPVYRPAIVRKQKNVIPITIFKERSNEAKT